jgi:hypothetical protein
LILDSYFKGTETVELDYSLVRKEGELIRGFGGIGKLILTFSSFWTKTFN